MPELRAAAMQREKERRAALRAPILVRVECRTPTTYVQAQGENISKTGMLLTCRETFEISQPVTLRFVLQVAPGKNIAVSTAAVVARVESGRFMGVRFIGLRAPFQQAIAEYITKTSSTPAPPAPRSLAKTR